jgi:hypothetical protein
LKGERSKNVPELKDFRSYIDNLKCPAKEQVFIKTLYLTGAKARVGFEPMNSNLGMP